MEKAIVIGFEALIFAALATATVVLAVAAPWPFTLTAAFPAGGCVVIGMIIIDVIRH